MLEEATTKGSGDDATAAFLVSSRLEDSSDTSILSINHRKLAADQTSCVWNTTSEHTRPSAGSGPQNAGKGPN